MNLQESIRRILREEVNESTFFRRRVDMSLIEKEFFDILNILTDIYLSKYNHGIDFNFETFEDHVIHYFMDGYYNDLTNGGENDYPFDEVYEFLSNHFHNKIKDRYDTHFGRNINENIRRILREETELPSYIRRRVNMEELDDLVLDVKELIDSDYDKTDAIYDTIRQFIATKKSFKFDYETERQYWDSYSDIEKPLVNYVKTKLNK
jgi:hypothetical protein